MFGTSSIVTFSAVITASWALVVSLSYFHSQPATAVFPPASPPILVAAKELSSSFVEGYWPVPIACYELGTTRPPWWKRRASNSGCPQWNIERTGKKWTGRDKIIAKLTLMEELAKEYDRVLANLSYDADECMASPKITIRQERGMAPSRMEPDVLLGNTEYQCKSDGRTVRWTDAMLPYYMKLHNVQPSIQFQEFVNNFDVEGFQKDLEIMKKKMKQESKS